MFNMSGETVHNINKVIRLASLQTKVLARLSAEGVEIKRVLKAGAVSKVLTHEVLEGSIMVGGLIENSVMFLDKDGMVRQMEGTSEFNLKIDDRAIDIECAVVFSKAVVVSSEFRLESDSVVSIEIVVETEMFINKKHQIKTNIVSDDKCFVKSEKTEIPTVRAVSRKESNLELIIKTKEEAKQILEVSTKAFIKDVVFKGGNLFAIGEIYSKVSFLTNDETSELKTVYDEAEFEEELMNLESAQFASGDAQVEVVSTSGSVSAREISIRTNIRIDYVVFENKELNLALDAYSTAANLNLGLDTTVLEVLRFSQNFKDEINSTVTLKVKPDHKAKVNSVIEKNITAINAWTKDRECFVEGLASFSVIYDEITPDMEHKELTSVEVELPFSLSFREPQAIEGDKLRVSVSFKSTDIKQLRGEEAEISSYLNFFVGVYRTEEHVHLSSVTVDEAVEQEHMALTLYIATGGDDLWAIAKKLRVDPAIVVSQNPECESEIKTGQQLTIFRQRNV